MLLQRPRNDGASRAAETGRLGERVAAKYLKRAGYRVVDRNITVPTGEADLVCLAPDRDTMVIVEVKARRLRDRTTPPPEAQITAHKRRKLVSVARQVVGKARWRGRPVRIDVVAVDLPPEGKRPLDVRHYPNAVRS